MPVGKKVFIVMGSSWEQSFSFNEAISFVVHCDIQEFS